MNDGLISWAVVYMPDLTDLGRLYGEHAPRLRGMLIRLGVPSADVDDALQEVFVVAWRREASLRNPNAVGAWLNGIAVRVAAGCRRRARLRRFVGLDRVAEPSHESTPASAFESREASAIVYAALEGIKEKKRTVFILFELQGMSGEEIAEAVGCPLKTVWTRLFHARREFVARLAELENRDVQGKEKTA